MLIEKAGAKARTRTPCFCIMVANICEDVQPKVSWGLEVEVCATSGRKAVPARDWTRRTETTEVSLTHDKSVKPETYQDLLGSTKTVMKTGPKVQDGSNA